MKRLGIAFIIMVTAFMQCMAQDSLVVVFWNMENFFDYTDGGGGEADKEFSSSGSRHWW